MSGDCQLGIHPSPYPRSLIVTPHCGPPLHMPPPPCCFIGHSWRKPASGIDPWYSGQLPLSLGGCWNYCAMYTWWFCPFFTYVGGRGSRYWPLQPWSSFSTMPSPQHAKPHTPSPLLLIDGLLFLDVVENMYLLSILFISPFLQLHHVFTLYYV